jgi:UDP-2,3-diacylglucosamine hydrolase
MPHTLFISDLHLSADHPHSFAAFQRFIPTLAPQAEALYILGDLFEYWAGDDDRHDPFHDKVITALHSLATQGIKIYLMHGNRDLLMGEALAKAAGATLLDDPTLFDLYGTPTLISHGDTLCTDDVEYQQFRAQVHDPEFQRNFLARPLTARKAYIEQLRQQSTSAKQSKDNAIMDANDDAVAALLRKYRYPRLIHGHTHRPKLHEHVVDGNRCERWVLSDWDQQTSALRCNAQGCKVISF